MPSLKFIYVLLAMLGMYGTNKLFDYIVAQSPYPLSRHLFLRMFIGAVWGYILGLVWGVPQTFGWVVLSLIVGAWVNVQTYWVIYRNAKRNNQS